MRRVKRWIKGILIFVGVLLLIVILAVIFVPVIFKPQIVRYAQEQVNKRVNADVTFDDIDISLFRDLPRTSIALKNFTVINHAPFAGDTLVAFDELSVSVNLWTLINKEKGRVHAIELIRPRVNAIRNTQGEVNWDILKSTSQVNGDTVAPSQEDSASEIQLQLDYLAIKGGNLTYHDDSTKLTAIAKDLDFLLRGDLSMQQSVLEMGLTIDTLRVKQNGLVYLPGNQLSFDSKVDADLEHHRYTLADNTLRLNEFTLTVEGSVEMPDEAIILDLKIKTSNTSIKDLLSLIPSNYISEYPGLKADGSIQLLGTISGTLEGDEMPNADLTLKIENGDIKYPDLPNSIRDINLDLAVQYNGKHKDSTLVNLRQLTAQTAKNSLKANALLSTPFSNPTVKGDLALLADLETLSQAFPLEGKNIRGNLDLKLALEVAKSQIETNKLEECVLKGDLDANEIWIDSLLNIPLELKSVKLSFNPERVGLQTFEAIAGKSDLALNGQVEGLLPFLFNDGNLNGNLNLSSKMLDLNQLFPSLSADSVATTTATEGANSDTVPTNLSEVVHMLRRTNFKLRSNVDQLLLHRMNIRDFQGNITLKEDTISLDRITGNMMDGAAKITGLVSLNPSAPANAKMEASLTGIDINKAVQTFTTLEHFLPNLSYVRGKANANIAMHTDLDASLSPILKTLNGHCDASTSPITIQNAPIFNKIGQLLANPSLTTPTLQPMKASFIIENGAMMLKPMRLAFRGVTGMMGGSVSINRDIDLQAKLNVPRSLLGKANELVAQLGANKILGENIPVGISVTGNVTDPKISVNMDDLLGGIQDSIGKKIDEVKDKAKELVSGKADELLKAAQEQGEKLIKLAEENATKIREQAKEKSQKLIEEAKKGGQIAEMAAKGAADKILSEGEKTAEGVISKAKEEAQKLIEAAKEKAKELQ